jgi:PAS domain S-box-containing protein
VAVNHRDASALEAALAAEQRVRRRLSAAHDATRALVSAHSVDEGLARVLEEVCRNLDFQWAALWIPAENEQLVITGLYEDDTVALSGFTAHSRSMRFAPGLGLPGRVWATGRPHSIQELRDDPNFPRANVAVAAGLRGGFGFPVIVDGTVTAVMEFLTIRALEPDEELLESMGALGGQIGMFMSRRRAEQALRESEERFRAFAHSVSDAAFAIDAEDRIVFANPAVERIFGHPPERLLGRSLEMLIPERLREAHRTGVQRYLRTGQRNIPWEGVELPALRADGSEIPVEISFGTYTIDGVRYFTGMVRDVSERIRQKEMLEDTAAELETAVEELRARTEDAEAARTEAEQANRAKSDFLAVISHELRTPLNAIIGYTDLLLSGIPERLPDSAATKVERVRAAGQQLLQLIEEILTFSRIESGTELVRPEPLDLADVVEEVVGIAKPLAARKGIALRVAVPPSPVESDAAKVRQILLNLVSNAVKFTDEGEVEITGEKANGGVLLRVRDTGIGIRPEHLPRIFDAFWQAETAATRKQGGTGLGLSVSRKLAQLLGGDIAVESEPGRGTTFTVLLPPRPPALANV